MIFNFNLTIYGNSLLPENLKKSCKGNFEIVSSNSPDDFKKFNLDEKYGFGSMTYNHPNTNVTDNNISKYEEDFVDFINLNSEEFKKNKVEEITIFLNVYYSGSQCNFEIFDAKKLKKLAKFNISLPISVYKLSEKKYKVWEREINKKWD
jgi:hypothetical protein